MPDVIQPCVWRRVKCHSSLKHIQQPSLNPVPVSDPPKQQPSSEATHPTVRAQCAGTLSKHKETFADGWDKLKPDGTAGTTFDEYVGLVANRTTHGGLMEIRAISKKQDLRTIVIPKFTDLEAGIINPGGKHQVVLTYDPITKHWDYIKIKDPKKGKK